MPRAVMHTSLDNMWPLLKLAGNPQDKLRVVHIAGTSGKTSTAYYLAALLTTGGSKIGLTVSPHIDSVTERVQINSQPLSERQFCDYLSRYLDMIEAAGLPASYFEVLYSFALWVFMQEGVEYAVVETGVGGTWDATNVIQRPDKVGVITDIGFDHMHLLGNSLAEIAAQKAGIIQPHNHVFMYKPPAEIMTVFEKRVREQSAELHIVPYDENLPELPAYQGRNWQLARAASDYVRNRDNLANLTDQELTQTWQIRIPGRLEVTQVKGKTIIMDGAHNAQKMQAFLESFQQLYPGVRPAVLLAVKDGKDYQPLVPLFKNLASHIITTGFKTTQDLVLESLDPEVLAEAFRADGQTAVCIADNQQALEALLARPESSLIITGSFYLLSQLRQSPLLRIVT